MNRLTAVIRWSPANEVLAVEPGRFSRAHLDLAVERTHVFTFDESNYFYNSETGVLVSIIGYAANIDDVRLRHGIQTECDVEVVECLYSGTATQDSLSFLDELDGVYFVLVYDEKREKVYLAQSEFGCPLPIYYTDTPGGLVVSTSMKLLLQRTNMNREFHNPSIQDFMSYGEIISNENTIVAGVRKLVTQRNMVVDVRSRRKRFVRYQPTKQMMRKDEAEAQLIDSIGANIARLARRLRGQDYALTLTGGWDSNLMLSFLYKENPKTINAVTINGGGATNEIPAVERVLKSYPNRVRPFTRTMQSSIFNSLPNVVWILEGYMRQSGSLLRYALAELMKDTGIGSVFLGSGADPILNTDMGPGGDQVCEPYVERLSPALLKEIKRTIRNVCVRSFIGDLYFGVKGETDENWIRRKSLRGGYRERYNNEIDYNMKMHELMLNAFGIQGLYPFVNRGTVRCAKPLRPQNRQKSFYKHKVRDYLGPDISIVLKKSGAVVDTESLFHANKQWLQMMLGSEFIERTLSAGQIRKIRANPARYYDSLWKVLYLCLFERLILSGKYDGRFDDAQIGDTLESVLSR